MSQNSHYDSMKISKLDLEPPIDFLTSEGFEKLYEPQHILSSWNSRWKSVLVLHQSGKTLIMLGMLAFPKINQK